MRLLRKAGLGGIAFACGSAAVALGSAAFVSGAVASDICRAYRTGSVVAEAGPDDISASCRPTQKG